MPSLHPVRPRQERGDFQTLGGMLASLTLLCLAAAASAQSPGAVNSTRRMGRANECTSRGGTASGSCAEGYGVCCTFSISCGSSSSQNCTYFTSISSSGSGSSCIAKICPMSNLQICQLRLDFVSFTIAQPVTLFTRALKTINGQPSATGAGVTQTLVTQCQTDTFKVTSPGNPTPPVICGLNTGQHMYVAASRLCNSLEMDLGLPASTTNVNPRAWQIKVTQYACDYPNLAPSGCTQYYFGSTTGTFQTFNFDSGIHLANQNQRFCFRKERGMCRICYSIASKSDFQTSWSDPHKIVYGKTSPASACCSYGAMLGKYSKGYDCLLLPAASMAANKLPIPYGAFCGGGGTGAPELTQGHSSTICSRQLPFQVSFLSDAYETTIELSGTKFNVGFRLYYQLQKC